jgi:glycosyltransferase involved in cell wall biosynthesis/ribosomal protein S18 acetylase RimI-like enzyme
VWVTDRETVSRVGAPFVVAHLTTVDLSLRFLVLPQMLAVLQSGGVAVGISAPGPWVEEIEDRGIRHIPLRSSTRGMSLVSDLRAAAQLWRILRREDITVLHTHNPKPGLYGRVLGRLARVPLVVNTMHGFYATEDDRLAKRVLVYSLEAIAARFSDAELHQNPEDLEIARRLRIVSPGRGQLLGNGVDLTRFDPETVDKAARDEIRHSLRVTDGEIVVGMVGRLVEEKGIPELFQAVRRLPSRYHVVVVGPTDLDKSDALDPADIEQAKSDGVTFLGMRSDMPEVYSAMDLFVLPSHREGFPRAAMEAASMGLPVIATDIRGCRQVVEHGENGLLIEARDPEALAEAILEVGEDEGLRAKMGSASRRIALDRFDERRVVEIVMETYRTGLVDKGMGDLLPPTLLPSKPAGIRRGRRSDARALARLHMSEIATGFLPTLGEGFLRVLYEALTTWSDAVVLVYDDGAGPAGFVAGVADTGALYKHFIRRFGLKAGMLAIHRLVRPSVLKRAWESMRYGVGEAADVPAELLSMVVAPRARGRHLSVELGTEMLERLSDGGADAVRVVVGSSNAPALGAYHRMGFVDHDHIEIHAGESSEVLLWRS